MTPRSTAVRMDLSTLPSGCRQTSTSAAFVPAGKRVGAASASPDRARVRVIFAATPRDDTKPKTEPDEESLQAAWLTLEEIAKLPLRGSDLRALLESVALGRPVWPLEILDGEMSV